MKFYINSNTGDYIRYDDRTNKYELHIARIYLSEYDYVGGEYKIITERQFNYLEGFIPIKSKKLFNRIYRTGFDYYNTYTPTVKRGVKEKQKEIIKVPDDSDIRDKIINKLLNKRCQ